MYNLCQKLKATPFPLADANGNCVTYLDNAGNVQAHYTYDAFGGTISQSGDMPDDFRFRFSSKYLDDETGFYYYGYRYFSPALGRWLSRDPIGERGGALLYGFVGNDGVNLFDSTGLMAYDPGKGYDGRTRPGLPLDLSYVSDDGWLQINANANMLCQGDVEGNIEFTLVFTDLESTEEWNSLKGVKKAKRYKSWEASFTKQVGICPDEEKDELSI